MAARVLVAGIGNLFLGDDGFGPEVVRRLAERHALPSGVRVVDYGIRGMHLAYDLLDPYDALVLVDALPGGGHTDGVRRGAPEPPGRTAAEPRGRIVVLEVTADDVGGGEFDAHGMDPAAMLAGVERLGGTLPATYVVGCRVDRVDEAIGLSAPVAAAVPEAIAAVQALVHRLVTTAPVRTGRS